MSMNETRMPIDVPLLDRKPQGIKVIGPPAVGVAANDVKVEATSNEVIVTFALAYSRQGDLVAQEQSKVVLSWAGMEVLATTAMRAISGSVQFRLEGLREKTAELEQLLGDIEPQAEGG